MNDELYIRSIALQDVMMLRTIELHFGRKPPGKGQLIEVFGGNEEGKTSLHDGIKSIFEGGKNPDLIREGCAEAIGIMELSDDVRVFRSHKPDASEYTVIGASGRKIDAAATYVKKLSRGFAFDPLAFDNAPPDKQLDYMLSVSDISFTVEEVYGALGTAAALLDARGNPLIELPAQTLPLKGSKPQDASFTRFCRDLAATRAAVGNRRDEKASTAESLRKGLLTSDAGETPRDWKAELAELRRREAGIHKTEMDQVGRISQLLGQERKIVEVAIRGADDGVQAEFQRVLKLARAGDWTTSELTGEISSLLVELNRQSHALIEMLSEAAAATEQAKANGAAERQKLAGLIAEAQTGAEAQIASNANRETMNRMLAEARALTSQYDAIAQAIKDLDALRTSKLEASFIPGLEYREDGRLYVGGVVWHKLNQATRYMKAVEIVAQGVGELGFLVCDKGESLDVNSRALFRRAVEKSGLQVVLFSVSTPEQIKEFGPALRTVPAGAIKDLAIERRKAAK